jgi:hypothetical protein
VMERVLPEKSLGPFRVEREETRDQCVGR